MYSLHDDSVTYVFLESKYLLRVHMTLEMVEWVVPASPPRLPVSWHRTAAEHIFSNSKKQRVRLFSASFQDTCS